MQITIDTQEKLPDVLRVIGAAYGVDLAVPDSAVPRQRRRSAAHRPTSRSARQRRSAAGTGEIRAWAKLNGYRIGDRGRISADIVNAFHQAGL